MLLLFFVNPRSFFFSFWCGLLGPSETHTPPGNTPAAFLRAWSRNHRVRGRVEGVSEVVLPFLTKICIRFSVGIIHSLGILDRKLIMLHIRRYRTTSDNETIFCLLATSIPKPSHTTSATYLGGGEVRVPDVAAVHHHGLGAAAVQDGGVRDHGPHVLGRRVRQARVGVHVDVLL